MAQNKKNIFSKDDVLLAEYAKVLSHPARIAILRHLAEKNTCICGEIVNILPLAQSTVSRHLKELKNAGLIAGEIDGPRSCYCINKDKYNEMIEMLNNLNTEIINNTKGCC
jgi:DNA-binding transcriptional ArsR family regulator